MEQHIFYLIQDLKTRAHVSDSITDRSVMQNAAFELEVYAMAHEYVCKDLKMLRKYIADMRQPSRWKIFCDFFWLAVNSKRFYRA